MPANSYIHHEFPDGFSAHWVRASIDKSWKATAYFIYNRALNSDGPILRAEIAETNYLHYVFTREIE